MIDGQKFFSTMFFSILAGSLAVAGYYVVGFDRTVLFFLVIIYVFSFYGWFRRR